MVSFRRNPTHLQTPDSKEGNTGYVFLVLLRVLSLYCPLRGHKPDNDDIPSITTPALKSPSQDCQHYGPPGGGGDLACSVQITGVA